MRLVSDSEGGNGSFNMFQGEISSALEHQNWPRKKRIVYVKEVQLTTSVIYFQATPKKA